MGYICSDISFHNHKFIIITLIKTRNNSNTSNNIQASHQAKNLPMACLSPLSVLTNCSSPQHRSICMTTLLALLKVPVRPLSHWSVLWSGPIDRTSWAEDSIGCLVVTDSPPVITEVSRGSGEYWASACINDSLICLSILTLTDRPSPLTQRPAKPTGRLPPKWMDG